MKDHQVHREIYIILRLNDGSLFLEAMILPLKKIHRAFYRYSLAFIFYVLWPFIYYASRKPSRYPMLNVLRKMWASFSSTVSGIFYRTKYKEPVDCSRPY